MNSEAIQVDIPRDQIAAFCRHWQVTQMALFGSVLRQDFRPNSDIDVLVTFAREAQHSVFDLLEMERDLAEVLGRKVDLVDRRVVEQSDNYIRRKQILESAEPVYGA